ncbi:MOSC domain-containing protein [Nocardiopsis listeri]|uniref:MOSC domain-containing protein n=1 Tax=Nocardiopsis listeri TaxID=53440 RepID=UPI0008302B63|nr:MOSC N-terminal beta barrel domain-containing protein [Nocardiopsis listeri]
MAPEPIARVSTLVTYPVKGCAGVPLSTSKVTTAGLTHDRSFMVVDGSGTFRSQRRDPRMARLVPEIDADATRLTLRTPGAEPLELKTTADGPRLDVTVHGNPFQGVDQGDEAAAWLTEVLGSSSRLVRVPDDHRRQTSGLTTGTAGFADGHAAVLASLSSLDLLNERILATGGEPVPISRFRPNVIVSGWPEAHTEDRVRRVRLGTAELGYAKVCIRCAVTTVDQETGDKRGPEPLRALAGYRRADDGGVAFCSKFAVTVPGTVSVGDPLEVTEWAEPEQGLGPRLADALA